MSDLTDKWTRKLKEGWQDHDPDGHGIKTETEGFRTAATGEGWDGDQIWFDWKNGLGGSDVESSELIWLADVLRQFKIKSVNDVGVGLARPYAETCRGLEYHEFDKASIEGVEQLDVRKTVIPTADVVICREVLSFMRYDHVKKVIENFKESGCRYLITTEFILLPRWVWKPKLSGEYGEPTRKYCQNDMRVCERNGEWWPLSFEYAPWEATPLASLDRGWRCLPHELRACACIAPIRIYDVNDIVVDEEFDSALLDSKVGWDWDSMRARRDLDKTFEPNVELTEELLDKGSHGANFDVDEAEPEWSDGKSHGRSTKVLMERDKERAAKLKKRAAEHRAKMAESLGIESEDVNDKPTT